MRERRGKLEVRGSSRLVSGVQGRKAKYLGIKGEEKQERKSEDRKVEWRKEQRWKRRRKG